MHKVLPILASIATGLAGLLVWLVTSDIVVGIGLLLAATVGVFLILEKHTVGMALGALLIALAILAFVGYTSPWTGEDGDIVPEFPYALQLPFAAGIGVLAMAATLVARWDVIQPRWLASSALGAAWVAYLVAFFLPQDIIQNPVSVAAIPGILALALVYPGVLLVRAGESPAPAPADAS